MNAVYTMALVSERVAEIEGGMAMVVVWSCTAPLWCGVEMMHALYDRAVVGRV
jgi:O-acetylhomoserine/O-acetylserine sulfhydrylase-like pyridoxal-dependent enzyme